MKASSLIILNAALKGISNEHKARLLNFLPSPDRRGIESLPPAKEPLHYESFAFAWLLDFVHYSWFLPTLKTYSKKEANLFLAALGEKGKSIQKSPSTAKEELSRVGREFLQSHLLQSLVGEKNTLLPLKYLPESELNILLTFSKKNLVLLTDYLSLYDLAAEVRQIVETKILKKIYSFLTEDQKRFLKSVMMQKEQTAFARMGLDRWDGDAEAFKALLHRRGLSRLGAALSGQHPDLIWYICHILDIGRGSALEKAAKKSLSHQAKALIVENIMELVPLIHQT